MSTAEVAIAAPDTAPKTIELGNTQKRDDAVKIQDKYQKQWKQSHAFEPTPSKKPHFFGSMAFPYMNGSLHLGHAFTVSKIEFAARFERMAGKEVLFPLGFHCTGMPIKACADKLIREIELFGKDFEGYKEEDEEQQTPAPTQETKADVTKFGAKKGKANAKTVKMKYQFQIMLAQGTPKEEIYKFADTAYWLEYYPPKCKEDLDSFGASIDWTRSMVTTDANLYFDSFVRWQMNKLKELGKIKFGKRYTVYSPKDGQACLDHDRSSGEGVTVQQYTALKLKVKEWPESAQKIIGDKIPSSANVYFVPATLRPETMYGQTCCYVGPKIEYGIFKASDTEYYFISYRAARNMSFQGIFPKWGEFPQVATLTGADVVGTLVNAPLSVHSQGVRILPMETVKATKGTGVVTSVPSDSPDDYATVMDLAKKAEYYNIKKEWAELEIIPIIETPRGKGKGNLIAKILVEEMKINSPKDAKQLAEAKDLAYKEGFYEGTMLVGDYKGKSVQEAKGLVKQSLIDSGDAFDYAEPDGLVISRSGDDCVAAFLDQWFLNYGKAESGGDGEWQQQVLGWVDDQEFNPFSSETKHQFQQTLDWLSQWACARSFGLGTKLPWDESFLVESLSDSTIYMAYYTISSYLHSDIFGKTPGKANIKPEQMTEDVWDYIFDRREDLPQSDISSGTLQAMRGEFTYWYPVSMRVSGKDLIQNHLTFFLYIHVALFKKQYWPRGIRANGHLLLNGEKMSKSTGNFLTLRDAVEKFSADATRVALADAGDAIEDANFEEANANAAILRLDTMRKWCEEVVKDATIVKSTADFAKLRDSGEIKSTDVLQREGEKGFWEELFENEMNGLVQETKRHYEGTLFKEALKTGFYDFQTALSFYRTATTAACLGMHKELVLRYIQLQALMLQPIAPHFAEEVWTGILGSNDSISGPDLWPEVKPANAALTATREYIRATSSNITSAEGGQLKKIAKGKTLQFDPNKDKKLTIFVAQRYPAWQEKYIDLVREAFDKVKISLDVKALTPKIAKPDMKKAMPFIQGMKQSLEKGVDPQKVFERQLPFNEVDVLLQMVPGLKATVKKCKEVEIVKVNDDGKGGIVMEENGKDGEGKSDLPPNAEAAVPGSPTFLFVNI
ncbi:leucyl-tRNA synthetase [Aulographum hederae CBS 113979]|uniref:leucine--tRNA ligase n=1 Tax=Aulographum hederae CBS 113979 TaxID=1176131 RepID=A0A6G1HEL7_9PEZI|nr:leucyl-tRNA synthetase [Aulographum hederae CBS 113979]